MFFSLVKLEINRLILEMVLLIKVLHLVIVRYILLLLLEFYHFRLFACHLIDCVKQKEHISTFVIS